MASKYEPFRQWLDRQTQDRVQLSFQDIEAILGFQLPASARALAQWWANVAGSHVQASAWMGAGWRARQVDIRGEQVTFERKEAPTGAAGVQERGAAFLPSQLNVEVSRLTPSAGRWLADYLAEANDDLALALSRALEDAALTRRRRLIDWFRQNSPRVSGDSADIIREDRDAR